MKEEYTENKKGSEENSLKYIKATIYIVIVIGIFLYKLDIVGPSCEKCGTIFNTKKYEIKTGNALFGSEHHYCDICADKKRKEIEKENQERNRNPLAYWLNKHKEDRNRNDVKRSNKENGSKKDLQSQIEKCLDNNDLSKVRLIIESNPNDKIDSYNLSRFLKLAIKKKDISLIKLSLKHGADINYRYGDYNPLHEAIISGDISIVSFLIRSHLKNKLVI